MSKEVWICSHGRFYTIIAANPRKHADDTLLMRLGSPTVYMRAVNRFLRRGDRRYLEPFRNRSVLAQGNIEHELETDPAAIRRAERLNYERITL